LLIIARPSVVRGTIPRTARWITRSGMLRHQLHDRGPGRATRVHRVVEVFLVLRLPAGERDLRRVDHDHVIAGVHVRRVHRLVLAAQHHGHLGGEAAQGLPLGVHHQPAALDVDGAGAIRLHSILRTLKGVGQARLRAEAPQDLPPHIAGSVAR
jgi:hypothetical protein